MDTAFGRYAFQMLVLLACVIFTWGDEDPTPTREVVELVSVVYKPARVEASAAGGPVNAQATAFLPETNAEQVASAKQVQGQAPVAVQHAKVASRQEPPAARSTERPVTAPKNVKVSCRPPACRAADPGKQAGTKRPNTQQARKAQPRPDAEPQLPAVFVPVRKLGLYLQARLGVEPEEKRASGS